MPQWNESEHPRDEQGKFTDKGGGTSSAKSEYDKMQERAELLFPNTQVSKVQKYSAERNKSKTKGCMTGAAANIDSDNELQERKNDNNIGIGNSNDNRTVSESSYKFSKPLDGRITSDFGYRTPPTQGASSGHSGIDIGVPIGTPVKSIGDGTVVATGTNMRGYGTGVFIDHGIINGKHVVSEYGHLSSYDVKVGDKIKQGQVFAKSGNTGISTGPHLHITIREDKIPVDPKKYFN